MAPRAWTRGAAWVNGEHDAAQRRAARAKRGQAMTTGQTPRSERHNMTDYQQARRDFKWEVAEDYNFAIDTIGKWARDPEKLAMLWVGPDGSEERYTFTHFDEQGSRAAHAFEKLGIGKGDR